MKTRQTGVGFLGMLTILFIALKLCGVIDWNWLLVISPLLIPFTIWLMIIMFAITCFGIAVLVEHYDKK